MSDRLSLSQRLVTFKYAARGIAMMFRTEFNARVHAVAAAFVVVGGFAAGVSRLEWLILVLTIAAVICLEAVNTAFEALCDVVSPEHQPRVEHAKDVAAGAVLLAAIASVVVAALVFGPRLIDWMSS